MTCSKDRGPPEIAAGQQVWTEKRAGKGPLHWQLRLLWGGRNSVVVTVPMRRALAWVTPAVLLVELVLVTSGVLSLSQAVWVFVLAEAALAIVGLTVIVAAVHHYRSAASAGDGSRWEAAQSALRSMLPRRAARAIAMEARAWWALARWLRHPRPGRGEFSYGRDLRPLLAMVIGLLVLEGVIIELVVAAMFGHGWWLWVLAAVHLYALSWILGILASLSTLPHEVNERFIMLRDSIFGEYQLPLNQVSRARVATTHNTGRSGLAIDPHTNVGRLCHGEGTVTIEFNDSLAMAGTYTRQLAISVDKPADFVATVQAFQASTTN